MDLILATSKAGHDKGQTFVVIKEEDKYLFLANGENKTIVNPKKKKRIHLQIIKNIPSKVLDEIGSIEKYDDISIRKILKVYNRRNENV